MCHIFFVVTAKTIVKIDVHLPKLSQN